MNSIIEKQKINKSSLGIISLEHDLFPNQASAGSQVLAPIIAAGFKIVTVGECLGDNPNNWYGTLPFAPTTTSPTQITSKTTSTIPSVTVIGCNQTKCGKSCCAPTQKKKKLNIRSCNQGKCKYY